MNISKKEGYNSYEKNINLVEGFGHLDTSDY